MDWQSEFLSCADAIFPLRYDGRAEELKSCIDALELLNTFAIEHQANDLAVKFVKTRLVGRARDLVPNEATLLDIMGTLSAGIKVASSNGIISRMKGLCCGDDVNKFCAAIETLAGKLLCSYLNMQIPFGSAESLVIDEVRRILGDSATCQCIKLVLDCKQFLSVTEVTSTYLSLLTDDHRNCYTMFKQPRFHRQQFRYQDPQLQQRPRRPQRRHQPRHTHQQLQQQPHHQRVQQQSLYQRQQKSQCERSE